jgi:hypothetical protein
MLFEDSYTAEPPSRLDTDITIDIMARHVCTCKILRGFPAAQSQQQILIIAMHEYLVTCMFTATQQIAC